MPFNYSPYFQTYEQKQLSFFAQPDPRNATTTKDVRMVNVFGEAYQNSVTQDVYISIRKRPGLVKGTALPNTGDVRGVYSCQGRNFFVVGATLYEYTGTILTNRFSLPLNGISSVPVTNGGSGYTSSTTLAITDPTGTGATITPVITAGAIVSVTVSAGGSNYSATTTITATDSSGSGAVLTPVITGGVISSVTVTSSGANYTHPTIGATDPTGAGSGATFTGTVKSGVITKVNVTANGTGYTSPVVTITSAGGGTGATFGTPVVGGTGSGHVGMSFMPTDADSYLMFTDGVTLWQMDLKTNDVTNNSSTYPTPMLPYLETIDGYLLAVKQDTADIYNSQTQDLDSDWDFTSAEMYPDNLTVLARYNNYLAAGGTESIEFFYDAALTSGSPFVRNMSAIQTVGIYAPDTVIQTDKKFFYVADSGEGERSVWMMDAFKPTEIATPYVRQALNDDPNLQSAHAFGCRFMGHQFYVIQLTDRTWAYDTYTKLWSEWTYNGGNFITCLAFDNNDGTTTFVTSDYLYTFDDSVYQDDGSNIECLWQTTPIDFETMNRKFLYRIVLIGDLPNGGTGITVSYSDDDYTTWSPTRSFSLISPRPVLVNFGSFRRRSFQFKYTDNAPLRLKGMELTYNMGYN